MMRRVLPRACATLALMAAPAAHATSGDAMADRVAAVAGRSRVAAVNAARPTELNVTVNGDGLPVLKAILQQRDAAPEIQLEATLLPLAGDPRDPTLPRRRRAALEVQLLDRDVGLSANGPYLTLAVELDGPVLEVNGLSEFLAASRPWDSAAVTGLDLLLDAKEYGLTGADARTLDALKEVVRARFTFQGAECDAVALLYARFPGEYGIDLLPRCAAFPPALDPGILAFDLTEVETAADGTPRAGTLRRAPRTTLLGSISGALELVPRTYPGELYSPAAAGFLTYEAGENGAKAVDFEALAAGGGAASGPCVAGPTTLCIDDQPGDARFQLTLDWQTANGGGMGGAAVATPLAPLGFPRGGMFSFVPGNPEFLIKIINGCTVNGRFWVFGAPTTTVSFELRVVDTAARDAGAAAEDYLVVVTNTDGHTAESFANTDAFATCDVGQ